LQPPCEIIVKHVLPTIRALVARELVENYDFTQVEAARRLGISQAAISWYIAEKRGHADKKGYRMNYVEKSPKVKSLIHYISKKIASDDLTSSAEITKKFCEACVALRCGEDFCKMQKPLPTV